MREEVHMDCLVWDLVSCCSRLQSDLPQGWMRTHLRMGCRPCFAVPVPFLLVCCPRLLSRTDNIELSGNPVFKGYGAGRSRLLPGCCRGVAGAGTGQGTLKATRVKARQSAVQLSCSMARDFCCRGVGFNRQSRAWARICGQAGLLSRKLAGSG